VTLPAQGAVLDLEDVNAAIGRLSTTLRQALTLVAIDNMTYDEAATVMGCKIGTVKSRVWRARESLAALVGYSADEIGPDRLANSVLSDMSLRPRA
jgi:DNA-directed RNA polymerase specialized sigma24 family protein